MTRWSEGSPGGAARGSPWPTIAPPRAPTSAIAASGARAGTLPATVAGRGPLTDARASMGLAGVVAGRVRIGSAGDPTHGTDGAVLAERELESLADVARRLGLTGRVRCPVGSPADRLAADDRIARIALRALARVVAIQDGARGRAARRGHARALAGAGVEVERDAARALRVVRRAARSVVAAAHRGTEAEHAAVGCDRRVAVAVSVHDPRRTCG